jgi:hypothetical protein
LRYKRKRSKKKIPNKSNGSAGFVAGYTLLSQLSIKRCGAGFYATWEGFCNLRIIIIAGALSTAVNA